MPTSKPTSIKEYIDSAPSASQGHLRKIYSILKDVAPDAEETIKWNAPFFIEPRFLFSFSATKKHCNFAPSVATLEAFKAELADYQTTDNYLQIPYADPIPVDLVRRIAIHQFNLVKSRTDDSFW